MNPFLQTKKVLFIFIGAAIVAFGLIHFNIENQLAEGGFTGISLILHFTLGIKTSISYFLLNIPVFMIGWKILGKKSMIYTVIGTGSLSIWLAFFEQFQFHMPLADDLMLAALYAGVFAGIGLGMIFRVGGTTGGVDIIVKIIHKKYGISSGRAMFVIDIFILGASLIFYLNYKQAMYTLVAVYIATRIIDFMNDGLYESRAITVISENSIDVAQRISDLMGRGVTFYKGSGFYHRKETEIVYCVVEKSEINQLKEVVLSVDPHAFITISIVHEVLGEGFTFDENRVPLEKFK